MCDAAYSGALDDQSMLKGQSFQAKSDTINRKEYKRV
jgi:hypothetical protein